MQAIQQTIDESKLNDFVGKVVGELGAAASAILVHLGDRLGLYRAMADGEPVAPAELARRTATNERYVREWLANQAAGGYLDYHPTTRKYSLPPEQAQALATDDSPASVQGAFQVLSALSKAEPRIAERFRTGDGLAWCDQDLELFEGTERFFRPGYAAHLVKEWIPALQGVAEKLAGGARVADVGCGHGASTILMAEAYPRATFVGYDNHRASIESARARAAKAGVADRVPSRSPTRRRSPAAASTWWRTSTRFTTWPTRWAPRGGCGARWHPAAPGCWSSRTRATAWRTT